MSTSKRPSDSRTNLGAETSRRLVNVSPRSARNEVSIQYGEIAVRVTAPPAEGAANQAVVRTLADALGLPKSRIEIVRGATSRQKLIRFDISDEELDRRLHAHASAKPAATE